MAASLDSDWGANLPLNAAPRTPPATFAFGHLTTDDAPFQPVSLPTEEDEKAQRLEVIPAHPTKFHELSSGARTRNDGEEPLVLDLLIERPLFQARGFLFSRFTRVWEGREVGGTNSEGGELWAVKQNWADADRINEAFLYEEAKDVPNVARLMGHEGHTFTIDTRSLRNSGNILGVYRQGEARPQPLPNHDAARKEEPFNLHSCEESPRAFCRVLFRMIFEQKGRSILDVQDCQELLEATKQWVTGISGLIKKGIIHRDVSSGNLLLGRDAGSLAFLIGLGLAHWSASRGEGSPVPEAGRAVAKAHHHLTGTLPFIAVELLPVTNSGRSIKHEVHHDVESVFWVLLYTILLEEPSDPAKLALHHLLSTNAGTVQTEKRLLLGGGLDPKEPFSLELEGRFKDLAPFLASFARVGWNRLRNNSSLELEDVVNLIDDGISSLPPRSGEKAKRRRESVELQEERIDGTSHKPSYSHNKKVCTGQGIRSQTSE